MDASTLTFSTNSPSAYIGPPLEADNWKVTDEVSSEGYALEMVIEIEVEDDASVPLRIPVAVEAVPAITEGVALRVTVVPAGIFALVTTTVIGFCAL